MTLLLHQSQYKVKVGFLYLQIHLGRRLAPPRTSRSLHHKHASTKSGKHEEPALNVKWGAATFRDNQHTSRSSVNILRHDFARQQKHQTPESEILDTTSWHSTVATQGPGLARLEKAVKRLVAELFRTSTQPEHNNATESMHIPPPLQKATKSSPLPYFISRDASRLNAQLRRILCNSQPDHINAVCYALLISQAAPNITTYNIMLRGFSLLRQNEVVNKVLRSLLKIGYRFDHYTWSALLNFYTSCDDYYAFNKTCKHLYHPSNDNILRNSWINSCIVVGYTKFRKFKDLDVYMRYIKARNLPESKEMFTKQIKSAVSHRNWTHGSKAMYHVLTAFKGEVDGLIWYWSMRLCVVCGKKRDIVWLEQLAKDRNVSHTVFAKPPSPTKNLVSMKLPRVYRFKQKTEHVNTSDCVDYQTDNNQYRVIDLTASNTVGHGTKPEQLLIANGASMNVLQSMTDQRSNTGDTLWQGIVSSRNICRGP